jgi:hypothetical protein
MKTVFFTPLCENIPVPDLRLEVDVLFIDVSGIDIRDLVNVENTPIIRWRSYDLRFVEAGVRQSAPVRLVTVADRKTDLACVMNVVEIDK